MPNHMLLKQQIICGRKMVVFVIFYGLQQGLTVETLLCFQVLNDFLIQEVWALKDFVLFSLFGDDVGALHLDVRRADVEAGGLRLVDLVPGVLADLLDVDPFVGVRIEDF
jgi:hypothetical protein